MQIFYYYRYITFIILCKLFFQNYALENNVKSENIASLNLVQNDESSRNFIKRDTLINPIAEVIESEYLDKRHAYKSKKNKKKVHKKKKPCERPSIKPSDKDPMSGIFATWISEVISHINYLRKIHQALKLAVNIKLTVEAQKLADKLANKNEKKVNTKSQKYGVLIYFTPNINHYFIPTSEWTKGSENIDYNKLDEKTVPHNFAQLIWVSSKTIGCGISRNAKGEGFLICLFSPKGSIKKQYRKNIRRPKIENTEKK
uniref:SCP domain-containing protein n=1 Tax=Strongyloides papillosus TaxID=174720 RepID=A0A0N5BHR6_STREA